MESLLRDTHSPTYAQDVINTAKVVTAAIVGNLDFTSSRSLTACLSLAATLCKLIWRHLLQHHGDAPTLPQHCELHQLGESLLLLTRTLSNFTSKAASENSCVSTSTSPATTTCTNNTNCASITTGIGSAGADGRETACACSEGGGFGLCHGAGNKRGAFLIHQMLVVTLVGVVQLH